MDIRVWLLSERGELLDITTQKKGSVDGKEWCPSFKWAYPLIHTDIIERVATGNPGVVAWVDENGRISRRNGNQVASILTGKFLVGDVILVLDIATPFASDIHKGLTGMVAEITALRSREADPKGSGEPLDPLATPPGPLPWYD